jgi:hypothetical protein
MISESDVERKRTPRPRSSECSSTALIRFPLCASATSRRSERQTGCEFSHEEAPVVEYRTWPTAISPGSARSFCSSNTWLTRPWSRIAMMWPLCEVAMPADSWPRCWSA